MHKLIEIKVAGEYMMVNTDRIKEIKDLKGAGCRITMLEKAGDKDYWKEVTVQEPYSSLSDRIMRD